MASRVSSVVLRGEAKCTRLLKKSAMKESRDMALGLDWNTERRTPVSQLKYHSVFECCGSNLAEWETHVGY
jgi:hypothetical protein